MTELCPVRGEGPPPADGEVAELVRRLGYVKQNGNSIPSGILWGFRDGTKRLQS